MKTFWLAMLVVLPLVGADCPMTDSMMPDDGMGMDIDNDNTSPTTGGGSTVESDWEQEARLTAFDPQGEDFYATSVAISDTVAIVGTNLKDSLAGVADVFVKFRGEWEFFERLTRGPARMPEQGFGSSVAATNNQVFVGASKFAIEGSAHIQRGAVYVYSSRGSAYEQVQLLTISDSEDFELFGTSMFFERNQGHLIVGAPGRDRYAGAAYTFRDNGGDFVQTDRLTASDAVDNDDFGEAVTMSNVWAAVGAPGKDFGTGAVYVFERVVLDWMQIQKLTADDGERTDQFGASVAMADDLLVVGAPAKKRPGDDLLRAGAVYIYRRDAGQYEFEQKLVPADGQAGLFGKSVAVRNDRILVGVFGGPALVFVYEMRDGNWEITGTIRGSDGDTMNRIGNAMAISEETLIVSGNDVTVDGRPRGGAGFVFTTPDAPTPPDLPPGVRF